MKVGTTNISILQLSECLELVAKSAFGIWEQSLYRSADKPLARPASRCILFRGGIFHLMLVL